MDKEPRLRIAQERGDRAKALLGNELLQESFDKIETQLMDAWKETHSEDHARREDAWRSYKLLQSLKGHLKKILIDGEASTKELLQVKNPPLLKRLMK